ncbi:MAG TPA: PQQ-binding-like beta-propeller repeat protein [Prolixibacteraceae bacterium]|jgi:outer membrane protein assembly factor BamB
MRILLIFIFCFLLSPIFGQETAQFRGPSRDGTYPEKGLLKKWPESGPKLELQIVGIGKGYSQPIVYKGVIYITGIKKDTMDVISAYDLKGKLLWDRVYGHAWANSFPDTRSTPTIQNDKIYLIGGMGTVCCLDAQNGNMLWSQDAHNQFKGEYHKWGVAESVLLTDQAAVYVTGGTETSVVAYDKITGKHLWSTKSLGGPRAYASSTSIERNGLKIILAQTANDLIGINSINGEILWNFNLMQFHLGESGKGANTLTPIYHDGEIFVTSGYDHPATMFSLSEDGHSVNLKWKNEEMDTHHGGVVLVDGHLYGSNWQSNSKGQWVSIDWKTGRTNWVKEWFNKGSIIASDGLLYCYEEKGGNVALVQPDVSDFKIISTFKVEAGEGAYWAHPAIYDGMLYLRHGNTLLIYNIKA